MIETEYLIISCNWLSLVGSFDSGMAISSFGLDFLHVQEYDKYNTSRSSSQAAKFS